jgi:hypothetical protein
MSVIGPILSWFNPVILVSCCFSTFTTGRRSVPRSQYKPQSHPVTVLLDHLLNLQAATSWPSSDRSAHMEAYEWNHSASSLSSYARHAMSTFILQIGLQPNEIYHYDKRNSGKHKLTVAWGKRVWLRSESALHIYIYSYPHNRPWSPI